MKAFLIFLCLILVGCSGIPYNPTREKYLSSHPNLSTEIKENITNGKISIGMTKEQVEAAWGKTYSKGKSISKYYDLEQWIYFNKYIVYFDKDTVSAIEELPTFY